MDVDRSDRDPPWRAKTALIASTCVISQSDSAALEWT